MIIFYNFIISYNNFTFYPKFLYIVYLNLQYLWHKGINLGCQFSWDTSYRKHPRRSATTWNSAHQHFRLIWSSGALKETGIVWRTKLLPPYWKPVYRGWLFFKCLGSKRHTINKDFSSITLALEQCIHLVSSSCFVHQWWKISKIECILEFF